MGRTGRRAGGLGVEDGEEGVVVLFPERRVEATGGATAARIFEWPPQLHKNSNTCINGCAGTWGGDREQRGVLVRAELTGNREGRRRMSGTPASNPCSLGARIEVRGEGNERGGAGLLIGYKKEVNRCVNLRDSCGGNFVREERVQRLEDEDNDVIADVTCGVHLSFSARKKKKRSARGSLALHGLGVRG